MQNRCKSRRNCRNAKRVELTLLYEQPAVHYGLGHASVGAERVLADYRKVHGQGYQLTGTIVQLASNAAALFVRAS